MLKMTAKQDSFKSSVLIRGSSDLLIALHQFTHENDSTVSLTFSKATPTEMQQLPGLNSFQDLLTFVSFASKQRAPDLAKQISVHRLDLSLREGAREIIVLVPLEKKAFFERLTDVHKQVRYADSYDSEDVLFVDPGETLEDAINAMSKALGSELEGSSVSD